MERPLAGNQIMGMTMQIFKNGANKFEDTLKTNKREDFDKTAS